MTPDIELEKIEYSKLNERPIEDIVTEDLEESIKSKGVIVPLIVRKTKGKYEIVAGQRRYTAAVNLGLKKVPCDVRDLTDDQVLIYSLVENEQRTNPDPIARAKAIKKLTDDYSFTIGKVGKELGVPERTIYDWLTPLKLIDTLQKKMSSAPDAKDQTNLSFSKGREIASRFKEPELQEKAFELVKDVSSRDDRSKLLNGLSVYPEKEVEEIEKEVLYKPSGALLDVWFNAEVMQALDKVCEERSSARDEMIQLMVQTWLENEGYL